MNPRPRLRPDLVLVEQTYRGEQTFILKDPQSHKYYRFRPAEIRVMKKLDGNHTSAEAASELIGQGLRVTSAAVEAFATKLTGLGLCERTLVERTVLLMERLRSERRRRLGGGAFKGDLFRIRWSVGDPDKLFDQWLPRLRFFFSRAFVAISVVLFALYFLVLGLKWPEFSQAMADLYTFKFGAGDLVVLWVTGTVIIIIHELGHGFTCKHFGGQVHEIGAMLIYFEPAFFCNVNDAWTFPELRARLWVTAAGCWIQMVVASLAAIVWWLVRPETLISEVALAAILVGGITTVFINLNPLIPLDGYYALSDYLEVPNLRQRAFAHLAWMVKKRVLRLDVPEPPADQRERRIFLIYGALAASYITIILTFFAGTALGWLSRAFGLMGILIFLVGFWMLFRHRIRALRRTISTTLRRQTSALKRGRRRLIGAGTALLLLGILVPWPITISGPFAIAPAVWIPVSAPDSGFIAQVDVREGTQVPAGAPLLTIRNLDLERQAVACRRVADSLAMQSGRSRAEEQLAEVTRLEADRSVEEARSAGFREQLAALRVRAPGTGVVVTPRPEELVGRWVSRGELVLTLGRPDSVEVRIALKGPGASAARAGQTVQLLSESAMTGPLSVQLAQVAAAVGKSQALEARLRVPAESWRPGMTGRARVTLRNSNVLGALWWRVRRTIRSDILL